jgi:hypothetical protein
VGAAVVAPPPQAVRTSETSIRPDNRVNRVFFIIVLLQRIVDISDQQTTEIGDAKSDSGVPP